MARITVAETLLGRQQLAEQLLWSALLTRGRWWCSPCCSLICCSNGCSPRCAVCRGRSCAAMPPILHPCPTCSRQETRPLVQAFNRQLARLRQLVARQERFSADAAHQLRTPLTILKTCVEVARSSGDPALMSESLDAIAVRLDHTIALTERLLLLARLKSDECSGLRQREPMELTALVQQACLSRLAQARSKGIDLGYEGEESAIMVAGEPLLLGELCANLLDNAIKYTPPHGTVTARVVRSNGQVWLEVEDSGPGIAPELAERVWQPFSASSRGANSRERGWVWRWCAISPTTTTAKWCCCQRPSWGLAGEADLAAGNIVRTIKREGTCRCPVYLHIDGVGGQLRILLKTNRTIRAPTVASAMLGILKPVTEPSPSRVPT